MRGLIIALAVLTAGANANATCLTLKQARQKYTDQHLRYHGPEHCWYGLKNVVNEIKAVEKPVPRSRPFGPTGFVHMYTIDAGHHLDRNKEYAQIDHMELLYAYGIEWWHIELTYKFQMYWWSLVSQSLYELTGGLVGGARLKTGGEW